MKYALKEWGTTIEALGSRQIIAIWRKGGIETAFEIEQKKFVLFPTTTHQNTEKVKQEFWVLPAEKSSLNKDNQIKVKHWAEIEDSVEIESFEQLLRISNQLINTNEHLFSSWNLNPEHKGKVLLLRVYKLSNPILVPYSQEYSSCKSWIELKIDIPKIGSTPVMLFKEFNSKARLIKALIAESQISVA